MIKLPYLYSEGLVIGKFIPFHNGHMALINYALEKCHKLNIAIVCSSNDEIDFELRKIWIKQNFSEKSDRIAIQIIDENLPRTDGHTSEAFLVWANYFLSLYSQINVIISSENYGKQLADFMKIDHIYYDNERREYPISGSKIMSSPLEYLNWLPQNVQSYFLKR